MKKIKKGFVTSTGNGFNIMEDNRYTKSIYLDMVIPLKAGQTLNISGVEQDTCRIRVKHDTENYYLKYTANKDTEIIICFYGGLTDENKKNILIEISDTPTNYEPYKEQTLTLTSDRPVTKWDKLVEQDGQIGWLFQSARKTFENDVFRLYSDNEKAIQYKITNGENGDSWSESICYCNTFENVPGTTLYTQSGKTDFYMGCLHDTMVFSSKNKEGVFRSIETFQEWIRNSNTYVWYKTKNTEFVPLSQSEQDAIRALKTYYPTTVIAVDGGEVYGGAEVTYIADTKNYIDNKVAANVANIISQYQTNISNLLSLMPMETQATMIENDTNNILESEVTQWQTH